MNCLYTPMRTLRLLNLSHFILLLSTILGAITVSAQDTQKDADLVYGYDPLLYNGMAYFFFTKSGTGGTQYLEKQFDDKGSVTVRGVTYTNLNLNYDIYNQKLILKYENAIGSPNLIEISFAWLEKFELHGRHFELIASADTTTKIFQVLGNGPAKIMYFQFKKLLGQNLTESTDHFFTSTQRVTYVFNGNQRIKYKNKRSFVNAFAPTQHDLILKYIRQHKLKVQKANDFQMTELINYCNTLAGK